MNWTKYLLINIMLFYCISCSENTNNSNKMFNVNVSWELIGNQIEGKDVFRSIFSFDNVGSFALTDTNWEFYFNIPPREIIKGSFPGNVSVENVNGDLYVVRPTEGFVLKPGHKVDIQFDGSLFLIKESDAPSGVYFTYSDGDSEKFHTPNYSVIPFTNSNQIIRNSADKIPVPTAKAYYERYQNQKTATIKYAVIPTPVKEVYENQLLLISPEWKISGNEKLDNEINFLQKSLSDLGLSLSTAESGGQISLEIDNSLNGKESYKLQLTSGGINIIGRTNKGIFYGIQSLLALLPVEAFSKSDNQSLELPIGYIEDTPRYGYRGMHLDAARNFQSKESVFKLIDVMAFYKLNKLHLHITDDEGWRIQIKALPELTEVGSKRGHTDEEISMLRPAYGSGAQDGYGSGYYTQNDYIEIIKYASSRHVEIIPEINMPGHARAAIVAMNVRYSKKLEEGDEAGALEYLLTDLNDQSKYVSVQGYPDNVVCVCNESVYKFYETVVDELIDMHNTAGAPLKWVHTGGDEVPRGVWEKSGDCEEFLALNDDFKEASSLQTYFVQRVNEILTAKGLITAGWEEVAMKIKKEGGWEPNKLFINKNIIPYVWNNLWGNQDLGYRLANGGFPVVLCNVTNLYFDLAYSKDPREPGYYWGGFNDTRDAWEFIPEDIYKSTKYDPMGNIFDEEIDFKNMERLDPDKKQNILGLQGHLWSETIKGEKMLEYYYLPKIIGLAERAWTPKPQWAGIQNKEQRQNKEDQEWSVFSSKLGYRELPRLNYVFGGSNYRIAPPGGVIKDGFLYTNCYYPGFDVRYTTDGSEPDMNSTKYEAPVKVTGDILIKAFDKEGNSSFSWLVEKE